MIKVFKGVEINKIAPLFNNFVNDKKQEYEKV